MHVSVHLCVCACPCTHVWEPEQDIGYLPLFLLSPSLPLLAVLARLIGQKALRTGLSPLLMLGLQACITMPGCCRDGDLVLMLVE